MTCGAAEAAEPLRGLMAGVYRCTGSSYPSSSVTMETLHISETAKVLLRRQEVLSHRLRFHRGRAELWMAGVYSALMSVTFALCRCFLPESLVVWQNDHYCLCCVAPPPQQLCWFFFVVVVKSVE